MRAKKVSKAPPRAATVWVVLPEGKAWSVIREGSQRAQFIVRTREEAVERGTALASKRPPSKLVLYDAGNLLLEIIDFER